MEESPCFFAPYRVALIGHRYLEQIHPVEERLDEEIQQLLHTHGAVDFYIGRNGDFDIVAASRIKAAMENCGSDCINLILVLPYMVAHYNDFRNYYSDIIIPPSLENIHPKSAITMRNRWLVDHTDCLMAYVHSFSGGAAACYGYAAIRNKTTILL